MFATVLSIITAASSLTGLWLQGNRRIEGFYLGLFNQVLWVALALATGAYGLVPMAFVYAGVYIRNIRKWREAV